MEKLGAPWPGAIAVSGGSDSLALMLLLSGWAHQRGLAAPVVLTVDHRLRDGSSAEARGVLRKAKAAGLKAHILVWDGAKPSGNIEGAAREARYRLMGGWCKRHRVAALYLGHTEDDQAETFLIRLARGSGLDGLSAMAANARWPLAGFEGLSLVRPVLGFARKDLRVFLKAQDVDWHEDPMNAEDRFARTKLRAAWPVFEQVGLTKARIADAASHLARARAALEAETARLLSQATRNVDGRLALDSAAIAKAPREIGLRALAKLLVDVGSAAYRPRFDGLESLFDAIISAEFRKARTLHGCRIGPAPKASAIFGPSTVLIVKERGRMKPQALPARI